MLNDKKNNFQEDDLSNMIDAYKEDDELRNKINELKKQKETEIERARLLEEEKKAREEARNALSGNKEEKETEKEVKQEEEVPQPIEHTRVDMESIHKYDSKPAGTTVVMKGAAFKESDEVEYTAQDLNDAATETDSDFEEFTENELESVEEETEEKEVMDEGKINKIITGLIAVFAGLLVIGGLIFAINFFSGEKPPVDKPIKDNPTQDEDEIKKPEDEKDVEKPVKDPEEDNSQIGTDNSVRIAEINGYIKDYENKIAALEEQIAALKEQQKQSDTDYKVYKAEYDKYTSEKRDIENEYKGRVAQHKENCPICKEEQHDETGKEKNKDCNELNKIELERDAKLVSVEEKIEKADTDLAKVENTLNETKVTILRLEGDRNNYKIEKEKLERELAELQK